MGDGSNALEIFNASTEFSGVISDGGNFGGLTISGGTQTLSGVNTYSNATQIGTGATLALKGNGSIANSAFVGLVGASATLDISQTNSGTSVAGLFGTRPRQPGLQDAHHHQRFVLRRRDPGWRHRRRHRRRR